MENTIEKKKEKLKEVFYTKVVVTFLIIIIWSSSLYVGYNYMKEQQDIKVIQAFKTGEIVGKDNFVKELYNRTRDCKYRDIYLSDYSVLTVYDNQCDEIFKE